MTYTPTEADILRVMRETKMDRMQAIYHLRGRHYLQQRQPQRAWAVVK